MPFRCLVLHLLLFNVKYQFNNILNTLNKHFLFQMPLMKRPKKGRCNFTIEFISNKCSSLCNDDNKTLKIMRKFL